MVKRRNAKKLSNSGSTEVFHEECITERKLRGRMVAVDSKVIKKRIKKAKTDVKKTIQNRTYSLSPTTKIADEEIVLPSPVASSTCIKDNESIDVTFDKESDDEKTIVDDEVQNLEQIEETQKENIEDLLVFDNAKQGSLKVVKKASCIPIRKPNSIQKCVKPKGTKPKVAFGNVEIIPKSTQNTPEPAVISIVSPLKELNTPTNVEGRGSVGATPGYGIKPTLKSTTASTTKNISYVKPCCVRTVKFSVTDSEDDSTKKTSESLVRKPTPVSTVVRKDLKRVQSQPSMTPKANSDKLKPLLKSSSAVFDKSGNSSKPATRIRLPNFTLIHNKNFEKMENVVEYTKRRAERANNLMTPKTDKKLGNNTPFIFKKAEQQSAKTMNTPFIFQKADSQNKPSFGFRSVNIKDRHNKHVEMARKMKSSESVSNIDKRKDLLKGVRLNKRFELQLKHRQGF